ncbi:transporter substrate-binding domain-containing protein [Rufibacter sediminis]|uniref:Transporter substrate-binding domain-containing protein n=1 Tax=Rufibacter sediminis TaxID=2762756 RepID=A0ABR6VQ38_9BACT|nr:transporter substrate-binding domain-containing protein [Rufibacter sediminis]MBC3539312.1 transporter substrate-binding domain-containing protein [Rufibacter sediminis]
MNSRRYLVYNLILVVALLTGCQNFPKDPEKTLEQVTNGTLKVGYSENPPWVVKGPAGPTGIEPDLVKAFANGLNAKIEWQNDSEQNLMEELEKHNLHLVIAGVTDDTPWKSKISFTRPYVELQKKKHVFCVIMGENAFITKLESFLRQQQTTLETRVQP